MILLLLLFTSCFTGIESTKRIELGNIDKKQLNPTQEELLLSTLSSPVLKNWESGHPFICTDDRLSLLLEMPANYRSNGLAGKHLKFVKTSPRIAPDGSSLANIEFLIVEDNINVNLPTNKNYDDAFTSLESSQLPMMTDLKMVAQADSILRGRHLFTLTPLWYDSDGKRINGRRFTEIRIDSVVPSFSSFPLELCFTIIDSSWSSEVISNAGIMINFGNSGFDSRSLASQLSLNDIRKKYPNISEFNWNKICNSQVALGMTKAECRLALGNPSDVNSGHDYSKTLDLWQYPDGHFLRFDDGILVDFR